MITAKEARERILALEAERIKHEQEAVEEKINKAVEEGESYCWLNLWMISQATADWLKSLGYIIEHSGMDDDIRVSW